VGARNVSHDGKCRQPLAICEVDMKYVVTIGNEVG